MRKLRLTTQITFLFSGVVLISIFIFSFFLNTRLQSIYHNENIARLQTTLQTVSSNQEAYIPEHFGLITKASGNPLSYRGKDFKLTETYLNEITRKIETQTVSLPPVYKENFGKKEMYFSGIKINNTVIIVITDKSYETSLKNKTFMEITLIFIPILAFGNLLIFFWGQKTVKKIGLIESSVQGKNSKKKPFNELESLAESIKDMQSAIQKNEEIKKEMLQNVSHDFKTPVSVIRSYAEAIKEGIEDNLGLDIIIKQTQIINKKIEKLLEITKIDYLEEINLENCLIRPILENILLNYKHEKIKVIVKSDESQMLGTNDYFSSMLENLLDNAFRYAEKRIEITVSNKIIRIFNDGEKIDEKFKEKIFTPYEKSFKGQTGLGLSIVFRIIQKLNLKIAVNNLINGVEFVIYEKE